MNASFAGITVPEGDPAGLRSVDSELRGVAGALEGVGAELRSTPGMLSSWRGPASISFIGACLTNGAVVDAGVQALQLGARAAAKYADELDQAQADARRAIDDAKEAQRRIERAEAELEEARSRAAAAALRLTTASTELAASSLTGTPSAGAMADRAQAEGDIEEANAQEARARRELEQARDDLREAQERGRRAEERARDAARAATGAFGAVGDGSPAAGFGAPGRGGGPGGGLPWYVGAGSDFAFGSAQYGLTTAGGWRGMYYRRPTAVGFGAYARSANGSSVAAAAAYRRFGLEPGEGLRGGGIRAVASSGDEAGAAWAASGYRVAERGAVGRYAGAARFAGRLGGAASFLTAGVDSYLSDRGKDMGQPERVARAGVEGGGALAGGLAGAKGGAVLGATIGTAVGGPVGTAVGGVIGGVAGGIGGSIVGQKIGGAVADFGSDVKDKIGGLFD